MFRSIVKQIVDPTILYHSTVKSKKTPWNNGKNSGRVRLSKWALTNRIITPYVESMRIKLLYNYSIYKLNDKHFNGICSH